MQFLSFIARVCTACAPGGSSGAAEMIKDISVVFCLRICTVSTIYIFPKGSMWYIKQNLEWLNKTTIYGFRARIPHGFTSKIRVTNLKTGNKFVCNVSAQQIEN
jgi:hypothetical protein